MKILGLPEKLAWEKHSSLPEPACFTMSNYKLRLLTLPAKVRLTKNNRTNTLAYSNNNGLKHFQG
jgi:hypothetical protein